MRIAYLAAIAALTLAIGIPASSKQQTLQKIPPEGSGFPKVQPCTAPCDWAFEKCVKKVQATLNKAESPVTQTSRNNNSLNAHRPNLPVW